jgi:hypothetical protein
MRVHGIQVTCSALLRFERAALQELAVSGRAASSPSRQLSRSRRRAADRERAALFAARSAQVPERWP